MSQAAFDAFSVTRQEADARADGGTRIIHLSPTQVVIERVIEGVRMKIAVPISAYTGLVLSIRLQSATATLYLRHEDRDLGVTLGSGEAIDIAHKAKAWGALFGKPIAIEESSIAIRDPFARQRSRAKHSRRSSFARRRKVGIIARLATSYAGEHEIIART